MESVENESNSINNYIFPKRTIHNRGQQINLSANYFKFQFINSNSRYYFKYCLDFSPDIPGDSKNLRRKVYNQVKDYITDRLGHHLYNVTTLYSLQNWADPISVSTLIDDQEYTVYIKWASMISSSSQEALGVYKRFLGTLVRNLKYVQMKRNYFNPGAARTLTSQKVEVWPGFNSALAILGDEILLNINVTFRVLREDTLYNVIMALKNSSNSEEYSNHVRESMKGGIALTRYNGDKTYIIDDIDFTKTPRMTFETKDGPISFMEYYKRKYGININYQDQPLILHKDKKGNEIYLIPEVCYATGLTDEMRSNFNFMKELSGITKGNGKEKMNECLDLINRFKTNENCKREIEKWGIYIDNKPIQFRGVKLQAGNLKMGNQNSFSAENTHDIDRRVQNTMFSQPGLRTWAVFCSDRDSSLLETFMSTFDQVRQTFNYPADMPKVVKVRSTNKNDWEENIRNNLNETYQFILLIIPGKNGKGPLYSDLKKSLLSTYPILSQFVLSGTVAKPKGLRSVVNKILIQICSKLGGEPWVLDEMPFTSKPTMICGIDSYQKGNSKLISLSSSYNAYFSRYSSFIKPESPTCINEMMKLAVMSFAKVNKDTPPQHIIIYRDGVSPTQAKNVVTQDMHQIKLALNSLELLNCRVTYIMINKKTNIKLFATDNETTNYNAPPGTLVDTSIIQNDINDFFLISQKTTQGLAQASHYYVVYDDGNVNSPDIHTLTYKLCYLYYNWVGSVKTPAPCKFAHKLSTLIGDKLNDKKGICIPHDRFHLQFKSLYFL